MGVAGSTGVADMWLRASDRPKAEARISAEELRMWGNRELTRQIRERF